MRGRGNELRRSVAPGSAPQQVPVVSDGRMEAAPGVRVKHAQETRSAEEEHGAHRLNRRRGSPRRTAGDDERTRDASVTGPSVASDRGRAAGGCGTQGAASRPAVAGLGGVTPRTTSAAAVMAAPVLCAPGTMPRVVRDLLKGTISKVTGGRGQRTAQPPAAAARRVVIHKRPVAVEEHRLGHLASLPAHESSRARQLAARAGSRAEAPNGLARR